MKSLIIAIFGFIFLTAFSDQNKSAKSVSLTCTLQSNKTRYKAGELPNFRVEIANNTSKYIYLIGALDGSDVKWRMPYCYFSIQKPRPDTLTIGRCGNMNTLQASDFRLVKAGEKFNPYENSDESGFFTDFTTTNWETFKNAGVYKIQFHYCTNSQDIKDFMGDRPFQQDKAKTQRLIFLFNQVPKVDLVSNQIEFTIEE